MQLMKSIEDKFELLSLRLKIEFFLFPLIVLLLISYSLYDKEVVKEEKRVKKVDLNSLKMKDDFVKILKEIESFSNKNHIKLQSIKKEDKNIKITLFSDIEKRLKFLVFLETFNAFSKIESLEFLNEGLTVQVSFNRFYKKSLTNLRNFVEKKKKKVLFKLYAIVGESVFINSGWFKKGETVDSYKIVDIKRKEVLLQKEKEKIKLKIYKDE